MLHPPSSSFRSSSAHKRGRSNTAEVSQAKRMNSFPSLQQHTGPGVAFARPTPQTHWIFQVTTETSAAYRPVVTENHGLYLSLQDANWRAQSLCLSWGHVAKYYDEHGCVTYITGDLDGRIEIKVQRVEVRGSGWEQDPDPTGQHAARTRDLDGVLPMMSGQNELTHRDEAFPGSTLGQLPIRQTDYRYDCGGGGCGETHCHSCRRVVEEEEWRHFNQ